MSETGVSGGWVGVGLYDAEVIWFWGELLKERRKIRPWARHQDPASV